MKHIIKTMVIAVSIATFCIGSSFAETSDAKKDDIKKLMDVTGAGDLGMQVINQMMPMLKQSAPDVPEEFWSEFISGVDVNKLVELCIPSYEKHFTHDEIKELLKFYETPLGKKMISVQPMIMQECMIAGQQWGQEIAMSVSQKLMEYKAK